MERVLNKFEEEEGGYTLKAFKEWFYEDYIPRRREEDVAVMTGIFLWF